MLSKNKFTPRVPWAEKMDKPPASQVKTAPDKWTHVFGSRMLIPTPREIEKIILSVPKGKLISTKQIRDKLVAKYNADFTCPLTTGIFLRILSEYAEEQRAAGRKPIPAYWRVVREDGSLVDKFHGGINFQKEFLEQEGFTILKLSPKKAVVRSFENYLVS